MWKKLIPTSCPLICTCAHIQIIKNKIRTGHSSTLTLLVGLVDGPDFSISSGGQDFNESLFICAGSLESPHKGHVSCSSDLEYQHPPSHPLVCTRYLHSFLQLLSIVMGWWHHEPQNQPCQISRDLGLQVSH